VTTNRDTGASLGDETMSDDKHTPGPWVAHRQHVGDSVVVFVNTTPGIFASEVHAVATPGPLCGVCTNRDDGSGWPVEANARLIAAAPDMLLTLEWIAENGPDTAFEMRARAHAAIAKATKL
jgi:hypothetical protein